LELVPVSEDRCWFPMQRGGKLVRERLLDICRPMCVLGCEPTILKASRYCIPPGLSIGDCWPLLLVAI